MIKAKLHIKLLSGLVALGMAAVASGCAQPRQPTDRAFTYEKTKLVVGLSRDSDATDPDIDPGKMPREINEVIADQSKLHMALDALRDAGAGRSPAKLGELLKRVEAENREAPGGLKSFRGLGGAYALALISGAKGMMGSDYDPNNTVSVTLSGLITGYSFDPSNNSGFLLVETTAVTTVNGVETESIDYVWNIQIRPNGYEIRTHSGDPDDPAPFGENMLVFDREMLDRINEKGFNKKLWAYGAGSINILSVTKDGIPVPSGDPLLRAGPDSCIDIMFKVPPGSQIPTNLAELQYHSYCLGRCAHPAIINSK